VHVGLSFLFRGVEVFVSEFPFPGYIRLISIHKRDSLYPTETDALGISVTVIAFYRYSFQDVKERMAKGAGNNASSASDAQLFVDGYPMIICRFPVTRLGRAYRYTKGFFTVIAGYGKMKPLIFPIEHPNPGTAWITCPCVKERTH
jgi:hypothetical protein